MPMSHQPDLGAGDSGNRMPWAVREQVPPTPQHSLRSLLIGALRRSPAGSGQRVPALTYERADWEAVRRWFEANLAPLPAPE